jgi:hypothetical protein
VLHAEARPTVLLPSPQSFPLPSRLERRSLGSGVIVPEVRPRAVFKLNAHLPLFKARIMQKTPARDYPSVMRPTEEKKMFAADAAPQRPATSRDEYEGETDGGIGGIQKAFPTDRQTPRQLLGFDPCPAYAACRNKGDRCQGSAHSDQSHSMGSRASGRSFRPLTQRLITIFHENGINA